MVLDASARVVVTLRLCFDIDGDVVGFVWLAEELDCEDVVLHVELRNFEEVSSLETELDFRIAVLGMVWYGLSRSI